MADLSLSLPLEQTVVIVGVGLIGGSLAAALKQRRVASTVIGVGRDAARIELARHAGLIDEATTEISSVVDRADVIVFGTPVDRIAADVRLAIGFAVKKRSQLLLTDVGSVKESICRDLFDVPEFVGSHPIAGSHRQGFEAADPDLFAGRTCVLTPTESSPEKLVDRLDRLWRAIGMKTVRLSPAAHDRSLAITSHVPHLVAAAMAATLTEENRSFVGTGFRDTTRIAAGDPDLWTAILSKNSASVIAGIDRLQAEITRYRDALIKEDVKGIHDLLVEGQASKLAIDQTG